MSKKTIHAETFLLLSAVKMLAETKGKYW